MSSPSLAFVLLGSPELPHVERFIVFASQRGVELTSEEAPEGTPEGSLVFSVEEGGKLILSLLDVPPPDLHERPEPLFGGLEPEQLAEVKAHLLVVGFGLSGELRECDHTVAICAAAAMQAADTGLGAMLGHMVSYRSKELFVDELDTSKELPILLSVDVTVAPEEGDRVSFLTHGLDRYGREELFVTASQVGKGALAFVFSIVEFLLQEPRKELATGDTIGRSETEKVEVKREQSPMEDGGQVIRLDLDLAG